MTTNTDIDMNTSFSHHIIFTPAAAWGHLRPSVSILFRIVQEKPDILATVPVVGRFKDQMDREVVRYCSGPNRALRDRIRIIQLSDFDGSEFECWDVIMTLWPSLFDKLWLCESITCFTGQVYPAAPRPSLCIIDCCLAYPLGASLIDEKKVKVLAWTPAGLSSSLSLLGPVEHGGLGDLDKNARELAEMKSISIKEATVELLKPAARDTVRTVAGLPPAYHYEFLAKHPLPGGPDRWIDLVRQMSKFMRDCDCAVFASSPILEEGALDAYRQWFKSRGKTCYALGPCVAPEEVPFDHQELTGGQEVVDFLDNIYESHGSHTLLYMSFGTSAFPHGDTPWQLIEIILEMRIPLIFAMPHGDTYEKQLSDDLRSRLESSKIAFVTKWAPQNMILNHRATGVFLTHGGQGSIIESLVAGLILIVWPLLADQPQNSMNLTLNLKVAYQLFEVRVKQGLLPLYRGVQPTGTKEAIEREFRQVLTDAFGADGEAKRKIAQELSRKLRETWKETGEALLELRRMLRENFP